MLGDRIGVGYWTDTRHAYGVVVLAVDGDESRAREQLARMPTAAGIARAFEVADGWALVLTGTAEVDLALRALLAQRAAGRLADGAAFRRGLAALPARPTALAWADLAQRVTLTQALIVGTVESATVAPPSMMPLLLSFVAPGIDRGTLIAGARATTSGVEVRLRGFGSRLGDQWRSGRARPAGRAPAGSALAGVSRPPATGAMPMLMPLMAMLWPAVAPPTLPAFDEFDDVEDLAELESDPAWQALTRRGEALTLAVAFLTIATAELSVTDTTTDPPSLGSPPRRRRGRASKAPRRPSRSPRRSRRSAARRRRRWDGTRIEVRTPGYDDGGRPARRRPALPPGDGRDARGRGVAGYLRARDGTLPGVGPAAIVAIGFALGEEDGQPAGLMRVLV